MIQDNQGVSLARTGSSDTQNAPLDAFYRQEVHKKIEVLEDALLHIDENGHFEENLKKIVSSCMQIMDLGMIHGYEAVEAIAESMYAAARYCSWQGADYVEEFRAKLADALVALKQVVDLTDPVEAQKLIDRARFEMDFKIDDVAPGTEDGVPDELWEEPVRNKGSQASLNGLFEIRELPARTMMNREQAQDQDDLDEDQASSAFEAFGYDEEEREQVAFDDSTRAFVEGEIELIEGAFDEILANKVHLVLDRLEDGIDQAETGIDVALSIQDIRDACEELKALSVESQLQSLAGLLYSMHRLAQERLENTDERLDAINLLREGAALLRDYLQREKLPTHVLYEFENSIRRFEEKCRRRQQQLDEPDESLDFGGEETVVEPPRLPFIVRLKRLFGMY